MAMKRVIDVQGQRQVPGHRYAEVFLIAHWLKMVLHRSYTEWTHDAIITTFYIETTLWHCFDIIIGMDGVIGLCLHTWYNSSKVWRPFSTQTPIIRCWLGLAVVIPGLLSTQLSANKQQLESSSMWAGRLFISSWNKGGPKPVPYGTPEGTSSFLDLTLLTSTDWVLPMRNASAPISRLPRIL